MGRSKAATSSPAAYASRQLESLATPKHCTVGQSLVLAPRGPEHGPGTSRQVRVAPGKLTWCAPGGCLLCPHGTIRSRAKRERVP